MFVNLPDSYPFVLVPVILSILLNIHHTGATYGPRAKAGIVAPRQYANWELAEKDPKSDLMKFNVSQRAHANLMEVYPSFLISLLISGLKHSRISTILGVGWVISRFFYHQGYTSDDPENRSIGGIPSGICLMLLWVGAGVSVFQLLNETGWQW